MAPQRKRMADLLQEQREEVPSPDPPTAPASPQTTPAAREKTSADAHQETADEGRPPQDPETPIPTTTEGSASKPTPKYLTLERKEVLLRPEQVDNLYLLRRRLNGRRGRGVGERLTENTLIRVAIDVLLQHEDTLTGVSEGELRKSVTSALRNSRTR